MADKGTVEIFCGETGNVPLVPLETRIVSSLNRIFSREPRRGFTRPRWTKEVKSTLAALARNEGKGFKVAARGIDDAADDSEWLLDMVWATEGGPASSEGEGRRRFLRKIVLAMECEWNWDPEGLEWDYQKLLAVRAEYRLFIFEQKDPTGIAKVLNDCKRQVKAFANGSVGDRYLLLGCHPGSDQFDVGLIVVGGA